MSKQSDKNQKQEKRNLVLEPEVISDAPDVESIDSIDDPIDGTEAFVEPEIVEPEEKEQRKKDVVVYDPLQAYLREISKYSTLSREEEYQYALQYYQTKDKEAARQLILANLWLVVKIARNYESVARNTLDLIQEGNIGLMEAVKNFDPFRDVRFPSYASWWIKAYIIRYVIANLRLVKIGTTQAQRKLFFNLSREKEKLEREGFFPAPKLLASTLNVREQDVIEMEQRLGSPDVSVDAPAQGTEGEMTLLNILPNSTPSAEDVLAKRQIEERIKDAFREFALMLKEKEKVIFNERMLGEEKATLQEIATKLLISKERVRQIENRLKEKLKAYLLDRLGENFAGDGY